MKKINTYIKKSKNATQINEFTIFTTKDCKKKDSGYYYKNIYQNIIEEEENFITFKAYIEKKIDISTEAGKKEYKQILEQQKSPLPNIIRQYEKEAKIDERTLYKKNI